MRNLAAIGALLLLAGLTSAARAETPLTANDAGPRVQAPALARCDEPGPRVQRPRRIVRHVRHRRHWRRTVVAARPVLAARPWIYYNAALPSPYDTAFDRGMLLHYRALPVSGVYNPDPGLPPTPPIRSVYVYRIAAGPGVLQYDGLTGEYIPLAASDAARVLPMLAPR